MRAQLHIEKRGRKLASACKGSNWPIVLGRERAGLRFFVVVCWFWLVWMLEIVDFWLVLSEYCGFL
jgi:hypothetical protein